MEWNVDESLAAKITDGPLEYASTLHFMVMRSPLNGVREQWTADKSWP